MGATIYTLCGFILEICAFHGAICMNTVKVFHEGGPILRGRKMVLKAKVKVV